MKLRNHGLGLFFAAIFLAALVGQALVGHADFNHAQVAHHDDPISLARYVTSADFGAERARELAVGVPPVHALHPQVEITFTGAPAPLPDALVAACERYAHLISTLIANKGLYSDFFKLLRRRRPMTMASELLWEPGGPTITNGTRVSPTRT